LRTLTTSISPALHHFLALSATGCVMPVYILATAAWPSVEKGLADLRSCFCVRFLGADQTWASDATKAKMYTIDGTGNFALITKFKTGSDKAVW
jgi:hypothetical protein